MARETAGARDPAVAAPEGLRSRHVRRLILVGLLVPCLLIVVPAIIVYQAERQLASSFRWVEHTLQVEQQLTRVLTLIVDAETGQRGFILTSSETYLEPYYRALAQLPAETAELDSLTLDNPVQQEHLRELGPLVAAQLEFMAETVSQARQGDGPRALDIDRGRRTMNAIRGRLKLMEQEESQLLVARQEQVASRARASTALLFTLVVLSLLFAVAMLLMLRRLFKLRELVKICAWSRTVEYEGEWLSFEQYLQRRFNVDTSHGISPVEAERVSRLLHTRPNDAS